MARVSECLLTTDSPEERRLWTDIGRTIDVYYTAEYAGIFSDVEGGRGCAYLVEDSQGNKVLYPFVRRSLIHIPYVGDDGHGLYDIITPYGYGGPAYVGSDTCKSELMSEFRRCFSNYCRRERIVSEFVRYHPLIQNHLWEGEDVDVEAIRTTVAMKPEGDVETVMRRMSAKARNMARRAARAGVTVEMTTSPTPEELGAFTTLYTETMDRRQADEFYFFSSGIIGEMFERMSGSIAMFTAYIPTHEPVSSAIILYGDRALHYHLSGSDLDGMPPGTNNLLLLKAAVWGASTGASEFHLGGGYSEGDGLFRFKASMSSERREFAVGRLIHDHSEYERLTRIATDRVVRRSTTEFFPAYRMGR